MSDDKVLDINGRLSGERKPWKSRYPKCYASRINDLQEAHHEVEQLLRRLSTISEEFANVEPYEQVPRKELAAAIVLLECAKQKLFDAIPIEAIMSREDLVEYLKNSEKLF